MRTNYPFSADVLHRSNMLFALAFSKLRSQNFENPHGTPWGTHQAYFVDTVIRKVDLVEMEISKRKR
jgi:hypothetical protein